MCTNCIRRIFLRTGTFINASVSIILSPNATSKEYESKPTREEQNGHSTNLAQTVRVDKNAQI